MLILGIESSCDETAAAIVKGDGTVCSNIVVSQIESHAPYGGVVPEIAARSHIDCLDNVIASALEEAKLDFSDLDGVAATAGPGLIGGVMVGLVTAKAICAARGLPLIAVNHLEGHALTARLTNAVDYPYLLLLISGGHCQLIIVDGVGAYTRIGTTIDDAVGEAFDKAAKMMQLGFPGGPAIERAARSGDGTHFDLPRPMKGKPGCDFSFSGLKTAVRRSLELITASEKRLATDQDKADLAAAFQTAIADTLGDRTANALEIFANKYEFPRQLVIAGGVAANQEIRESLSALAETKSFELIAPPAALCTDNAAMIAWAGVERLGLGLTDPLDVAARARWPLDSTAPSRPFAGAKA